MTLSSTAQEQVNGILRDLPARLHDRTLYAPISVSGRDEFLAILDEIKKMLPQMLVSWETPTNSDVVDSYILAIRTCVPAAKTPSIKSKKR